MDILKSLYGVETPARDASKTSTEPAGDAPGPADRLYGNVRLGLNTAFTQHQENARQVLGMTREEVTADQTAFVADLQRSGLDPALAAVLYDASINAQVAYVRGASDDDPEIDARVVEANERALTLYGAETVAKMNAFIDSNPNLKARLNRRAASTNAVLDAIAEHVRRTR